MKNLNIFVLLITSSEQSDAKEICLLNKTMKLAKGEYKVIRVDIP